MKGLDGFRCGVQSIAKDIAAQIDLPWEGKSAHSKVVLLHDGSAPQDKLRFQTNKQF